MNATDDDTRSNISERAEESLLRRLEEKAEMRKKSKVKSRRKTRSSRWINAIGFKRKEIDIPVEKEAKIEERETNNETIEIKKEDSNEEPMDNKQTAKRNHKNVIQEDIFNEDLGNDEIEMKLIPVEISSNFIGNRSSSSGSTGVETSRGKKGDNLRMSQHKKIFEISKKLEEIKKSTLTIRNQMDVYMKKRQPRPGNAKNHCSPNSKTKIKEIKTEGKRLKKFTSKKNLKNNIQMSFITPKFEKKGIRSSRKIKDRFSVIPNSYTNKKIFSTVATSKQRAHRKKKSIFQDIEINQSKKKSNRELFRSHENVSLSRKQKKGRKKMEKFSIKKLIEKLSPKNNHHVSYWDKKTSPKKIKKRSLECSKITTTTIKSNLKKKKKRTKTNCFDINRSISRKSNFLERGKSIKSQNQSNNAFDFVQFETVGDYSKYRLRRNGSGSSLSHKSRKRLRKKKSAKKKKMKIRKINKLRKSGLKKDTVSLAASDVRSRKDYMKDKGKVFRNLMQDFLDSSVTTNTLNQTNQINQSTDLNERIVSLLPDRLVKKLKNRKYYKPKKAKKKKVNHFEPALYSLLNKRDSDLNSGKNTNRSMKKFSEKKRRHTSLNNEVNLFDVINGRMDYRKNLNSRKSYFISNNKLRTKSVVPDKSGRGQS